MTILHLSVRSTLASALPTSMENRPLRGRTPAQLEDILGKTGYAVFRIDCAKVHEVPPNHLKLKYTGWEDATAIFSCTGRRLGGCAEPWTLFFLVVSPERNPHRAAWLWRLKSWGSGGFQHGVMGVALPPCCQPVSLLCSLKH